MQMQVLTAASSLPRATLLRPAAAEPWCQSFLQLQAPSKRPGIMLHCKAQPQGQETRERRQLDDDEHARPPQGGDDDVAASTSELPYMIESIKSKLRAARNSLGETTVSAYDTAWIALVNRLDGGGERSPQFPEAIDWIARNQLLDGSWGDAGMFIVQDRLINTLGCVVALATWGVHEEQRARGLAYIQDNLWRLGEDDEEWMMVGFEITFPVLLEKAKNLGLDINYDDPALQDIYAKRQLKLAKIPREALHARPTTLLHSLEGMENLDWERLLQFKCPAGSLHSSPAASAYALSETGDKELLEYLETAINNFDGGDGMSYGGLCPVKDIDDTAMAFRLLRLHGYNVSSSVFNHFEKDGEYFCFAGQSSQSLTAMYNSYRASQIVFPGDDDGLEQLRAYCRAFLEERRATGNLRDKWVIANGLPSEVEYALDFPWKASLPRVETRVYLEQYGASEDAWIGKGLYRMTLVNNDLYLEAAKADFTNFQRLSRLEWLSLKRNNLQAHGVTEQSVLRAYFLAAANIFEPNRAAERLGWARTAILAEAIASHLRQYSANGAAHGMTERLISGLASHDWDWSLLYALDELIDLHAFGNASDSLREAWKQWLMSWTNESQGSTGGDTALLLVRTIEICSGRHGSAEQSLKNSADYARLEQIASSMCSKLATKILAQNGGSMDNVEGIDQEVDVEMKELIQRVYGSSSNDVSSVTRQTFLDVVKSFCYVAHCSPEIIDGHISKVLFEDVN
uniref:Ent-kaurene synthase A n=1 Tax=Oryza meridionalis TaxID=40149 RepID=A0A0E0CM94_9ORYZ